MTKKWIIHEFLHTNRRQYGIGIIALILSCILQIAIPRLLSKIMDALKYREGTVDQIAFNVILMICVAVILFGLKFIWRYNIQGKARDLECFIREKLYAHLQTLPVSFYHNNKTGDLMAYAINDISALRSAFSFGVVFLIDGFLINTLVVLSMFQTINATLTLLAIGPVIIASIAVVYIRPKIRSRFTRVQEAFADISDKVQENISGIRVVKGFVQEDNEIKKLKVASKERADAQMSYIKLSAFLTPFIDICFGISFSVAILLGSRYVAEGSVSFGDYIAFNTYMAMLHLPVKHLGRIVEVWQKAFASIKRLDDIFIIKNDIVVENPIFEAGRFKEGIVVKNLSFKYPGSYKNVLTDINFDLKAGKTLAIIGDTGSGKSSLVNLLLRLYNVDRGHIFIDGIDINDIPVELVRENIALVPQENFLFSTTIKDNISTFHDDFAEEDIENAAFMADVHSNIMEFPDKYETVVGERGITLSGGQRQRVSIARALIRHPDVLILDDSLSAVDTKTEETILDNIRSILKDGTGIIISHRVSSVKHADEVLVLDKGRVIEKGTHDELIERKGKYYLLYKTQSSRKYPEELNEKVINL